MLNTHASRRSIYVTNTYLNTERYISANIQFMNTRVENSIILDVEQRLNHHHTIMVAIIQTFANDFSIFVSHILI